jgi:asparagine synthase (glutamine-hydrolysing)
MSQLLIVQGEDPNRAAALFRKGVAASSALNGRRPLDCLEEPGLHVAVFPRPVHPAGIVRYPGGWACGAGAWLYDGQAGVEGLRRLVDAPRRNLDQWLRPADGAFAIALQGDRPGEILAITDRLGTIHLYKARDKTGSGSCVLLGTSALTLAAVLDAGWDPAGVRYFLATGSVFERHSLFAGVEKLPPATVLRFERGAEAPERKYWTVAGAAWDKAPVRGEVAGLADGLRRAMAAIGANYGTPALDLTGGYDSRALVGAMLQEPGLRFDTVVNGPAGNPDVAVAGRIASEFGIPHLRRDRGPSDPEEFWRRAVESAVLSDGECDALLQAPVVETHSRLAERFDASVNGSNGEICKGQWWEILLPYIGRRGHFDHRAVAANRFAYGASAAPLLAARFDHELVEDFAGIIRRATSGMEDHPNTALLDCVYLTLRMQRWQGRIMSASAQLWPVFSPFAFREPMEMALAAPPSLRVRHRMSRRVLEFQNPKLAALPLAQGYPALPVRWNNLHRFWPLAVETGRTVGRAALRRAGLLQRRDSFSSYPLQRIAHLEEVRELLRPERMASADVYDDARLRAFLAVDLGTVVHPERYGRVLTLELAARAVRRAARATEPAG